MRTEGFPREATMNGQVILWGFPNSSVLSKQRPFLFLDCGLLRYMLFSFSKRQLPLKRFPYLPLSGELPYEGGEKGFLKSPSSLRVCLPIAEIPLTNRFCLERLFLILFTYKLKVTSHCSQHLRGPRVDSLISEAQPSSKDPKFINCEVSTSASLFFLVEMRNSKRKANGLRNPVSYNIGFLLQSRGEETGEERGEVGCTQGSCLPFVPPPEKLMGIADALGLQMCLSLDSFFLSFFTWHWAPGSEQN